MPTLNVIDANSPWVRSLAEAAPEGWRVNLFQIYHPRWLPNGTKDVSRLFRWRQVDIRTSEILLTTPGWRRFNGLSSSLANHFIEKKIGASSVDDVILFTFPFYSEIARLFRKRNPRIHLAYWAHDAFEFYGFPPGFVEFHENRIVPLCDSRFAMAPLLVEDYSHRYPDHPFRLLHDAVSSTFIESHFGPPPPDLNEIKGSGRPVVGCIGQINRSYDWPLLEAATAANPRTQFIFIGNLFEEGEATNRIRKFFERDNVHWLGRVDHHLLPAFLHAFDICLNPLAVSEHNHRRDPLRIYDYLTTDAPIVSTDLDGVRMHRDYVEIFSNPAEFITRLSNIPEKIPEADLERRRAYIRRNTWEMRALQFTDALSSFRTNDPEAHS